MNVVRLMLSLRLHRGALMLLMILVAGGCATPASGPMPPLAPVQRVGIVSLIGDRVQWNYFGNAIVSMFDEYLPLAVKQPGLQ